MKKYFALSLAVLMVLGFACSCKPEISNEDSSLMQGGDSSVVLENEKDVWDMSEVSAPVAVDSFEVAVLAQVGDPTSSDYNLYYNGKTYPCNFREYMGEYNGRYYFFGTDVKSRSRFYSSCDKKYKDYKVHQDFSDEIEGNALLYNGKIYQRDKKGIRAYSVETKEWTTILDADAADGLGEITSIADGWIYGEDIDIYALNIETGELIKRKRPQSAGVFVDGKNIGCGLESNNYTNDIRIYDLINDELKKIDGINSWGVIVDDNGDVWAEDYQRERETNILRRVHKGIAKDSVHAQYDNLTGGWYYYRYTLAGGDTKCVARLNLSTGEHQYCPEMIVESEDLRILPHFWGNQNLEEK